MSSHYGFTGSQSSLHPTGATKGRSLDRAARWLFETQVSAGSLATMVADGAFRHYGAGLFQFVAIRVGPERAASLLEKIQTDYERTLPPPTSEGQEEAPSSVRPGLFLYRSAYELVRAEGRRPLPPDARQYWVPAEEELANAVVRLRQTLTPQEMDTLELCHCRGLDPDEAAAVQDIERTELNARLTSGLTKADKVITKRAHRGAGTRERLLLQAFALDPRRTPGPPRPERKPVLEVGSLVHNRYEIEGMLGAGAFADVYRARDREVTDHVVALKILRRPAGDAHAVRTALRELQLIASVFHPSVVQLKDHGWHNGHLWFVMPLYRGETLAQRIEREPLNRRQAREIFEPLAEALGTMHRLGVRHQDVKPENVFLANIGSGDQKRVLPVLLDLGVAAKDVELVLAGTPAYFAPEVAARFSGIPDPPTVGPQADVFSLALTLRDALDPTPRDYVARGAVDAFVAYRAHNSPEPPWRDELKDLRSSFERWLHLSPDARPSAEVFRTELAILTRPEERRTRQLAVLRWAAPVAFATLTLFASVVYVLSKEAALRRSEAEEQRDRATSAQEKARTMHATLEAEEALRRMLEAEVARLETSYQNSRFTREELARRLASVEGELTVLGERHTEQTTRLRKESDELRQLRQEHSALEENWNTLRERRDELARELDRTKGALAAEQETRNAAEASAHELEAKLKGALDLVAQTRAQMNALVELVRGDDPDPPKVPPPATDKGTAATP